jgi:hypothetical protein
MTAVWLSACAQTAELPLVELPEGVDGYQCYRRESTPKGDVYAEGYPDYRGGYASLTTSWEYKEAGELPVEAKLLWSKGPQALESAPWLTVNLNVGPLPPRDSWIYLRLSSGEVTGREFVDRKTWREWSRGTGRYGSFVLSSSPAFIEAFTRANWAEISVVAPDGARVARRRFELEGLPAALAVMRRLGQEVAVDTAEPIQRCGALHLEIY